MTTIFEMGGHAHGEILTSTGKSPRRNRQRILQPRPPRYLPPYPISSPLQALPADPFFAQVIASVRRHEARARRAEYLTGEPFSCNLSSTASFSGLPVHLLRRLCRSGELQAATHNICVNNPQASKMWRQMS